MQASIERVIASMWAKYSEPLSLTEMADIAFLSRFHFSRVFRTVTGTSPGRYLTAIRLYKAKNLLLATPLSVTDISYEVGYNSPGTFTSRFTKCVGVSPSRYRGMSQAGMAPLVSFAPPSDVRVANTVVGNVDMPDPGVPYRVYVAPFDSPIASGIPAACDVLDAAGQFRLGPLPDGKWFVRAAAVAVDDLDPRPWKRRPLFVADPRHVTVRGGVCAQLDFDLRPLRPTDLPILLALPELDSGPAPSRVRTEAVPRPVRLVA